MEEEGRSALVDELEKDIAYLLKLLHSITGKSHEVIADEVGARGNSRRSRGHWWSVPKKGLALYRFSNRGTR